MPTERTDFDVFTYRSLYLYVILFPSNESLVGFLSSSSFFFFLSFLSNELIRSGVYVRFHVLNVYALCCVSSKIWSCWYAKKKKWQYTLYICCVVASNIVPFEIFSKHFFFLVFLFLFLFPLYFLLLFSPYVEYTTSSKESNMARQFTSNRMYTIIFVYKFHENNVTFFSKNSSPFPPPFPPLKRNVLFINSGIVLSLFHFLQF